MKDQLKNIVPALVLSCACMGASFAVENDPFAAFNNHNNIGAENQLRWGGYGEMHYNNFQNTGEADIADLHRLVFLAEYDFDDKISFFTEIEIEHAFVQGGQGELEVEQAYIDFKINESVSIQAGVILVPFSILNLFHEPTLFYGVERSYTQKVITPSTWFEPGVAISGDINEQLSYQAAIQSGLDNRDFSDKGIRSGRQKAYKSASEDLMFTGRMDYRPMPELWFAAAVNFGNSAQDATDARPDGAVFIYTLEARYDKGQCKAGLTWTSGTIGDASELSQLLVDLDASEGTTDASTVADSFNGLELFAGVDIMPWIKKDSENRLDIFAKFETFDTQASVPSGFAANDARTGTVVTVGLDYKPHSNVVIKLDYQDFESDDNSLTDQWNLGIGWMF